MDEKTTPTTIDEYIAGFPDAVQAILQKMRRTIQAAAPEATETISYQMPTFKLNGKALIHFAAFKHHIGLYPTPSGITAFDQALAPYKRAKGSVQFPLENPVPYDLVKRITEFRVGEAISRQ
ncbi:MAG: iron chaperone [Dehalogenimonas sp.]